MNNLSEKNLVILNDLQNFLFETKQTFLSEQFFANSNKQSLGEHKKEAFTLVFKLEELGFTPSKDLLYIMSNASLSELDNFWKWMIENQNNIYHGHSYAPMYPNFPKEVIQMHELEILENALIHYTGAYIFDISLVPDTVKKARKKLAGKYKAMQISTINDKELLDSFSNLVSSNVSLSLSNNELLGLIYDYFSFKDKIAIKEMLKNAVIPQKENLANITAKLMRNGDEIIVEKNFNNPTDVLRLAAALSFSDVSLSSPIYNRKISRNYRRTLLSILENLFEKTNDSEQFLNNMLQKSEMWKRLSHALHAGEYKARYPLAFEAIDKVRNNYKVFSYEGTLNALLNKDNVSNFKKMPSEFKPFCDLEKNKNLINFLQERPGVFARKLNEVLVKVKKHETQVEIVNGFFECAHKVSTPVLLQMQARFKNYYESNDKIILPKSSKVYVVENYQKGVRFTKDIVDSIVNNLETVLIERFSHGSSLGNVFIDENLKTQNVPFSARNASKAIKTITRGSRIKKESNNDVMRFFIWWNEQGVDKNGNAMKSERIDLDLSVAVLDKNGDIITYVSYYHLKTGNFMVHSGDFVTAPNGAAEYVDVNLSLLQKDYPNAEYIVPLVSSYSNQNFAEMPECFAGWMERKNMKSGEIFEAKTVQNKIDLVSSSTQTLIAIYDIPNKEYIWADMPIKQVNYYSNNLHSVKGGLAYTVKGLAEMKKPVLFDLFEMHGKARGTIVDNKEDADTVFSLHEGITPFDFEVIAANYMADSFKKPENNPVAKKKL